MMFAASLHWLRAMFILTNRIGRRLFQGRRPPLDRPADSDYEGAMPDDVEDELRDFRRKAWRTIRILYVLMMLVYAASAALFIRDRQWGNLAQIITLMIFVTVFLWFQREVARIRGDL